MIIVSHGDLLAENFAGQCHRCGCRLICKRHEAQWVWSMCKTDGRWRVKCPECEKWGVTTYLFVVPQSK